MNEQMRQQESGLRTSAEYARAQALLAEREKVEHQLQDIDRQLDALAGAGKLAKIDKLRAVLHESTRVMPLAG